MIVEVFELYEVFVGMVVLAGITFILYSDRFLVVYPRFLIQIAIGTGLAITTQVVFLFYWPAGLQLAHLLFASFIAAAVFSLVDARYRWSLSLRRIF